MITGLKRAIEIIDRHEYCYGRMYHRNTDGHLEALETLRNELTQEIEKDETNERPIATECAERDTRKL